MFGHQNDDQSAPPVNDSQSGLAEGAVDTEAVATDRPSGAPAASSTVTPVTPVADAAQPADTAAATAPSVSPDPDWQHPGTPIDDANQPAPPPAADKSSDKDQIVDVISPAGGFPKHPTFSSHSDEPKSDDSVTELLKPKIVSAPETTNDSDKELVEIRQKALTELRPIVDKLDLPPDEKFRTIMMIIQVSDDEALVKAAYEAAHAITDDKDRAQALLDIVNEVNYFTHQPDAEKPEI